MALGGMGLGSFIDGLYQTYMGRAADAEGRSFWENSGLSEDELIAKFSQAGQANSVPQTESPAPQVGGEIKPDARQDYIRSLYSDVLGREADQAGLDYWSNSGMDEAGLFNAFDDVPDARRYEIADMYRDYFGREADNEGLDYWANSGMDAGQISRAFYESPEAQTYLARQQQNGPYQAWMQPLAPSDTARTDLQTMAEIYRQFGGDAFAAGMLGNQYTESRNDPQQMQIGANGQPIYQGGAPLGYGLNQLSAARQADLKKFAEQYGLDPNSAEGQARFHVWELNNTERGALNQIKRLGTTDESAASAISRRFIRPGKPHLDQRLDASRAFGDWIRGGMRPDDPNIMQYTAPLQQPQGTPPEFLEPDYGQPLTPYTPGPGSSYQGQTIDPLTGQWMDYGAVNMGMQPVQQPGSTMVSGNLYQANPSGFADGSLGSYNNSLGLSPNSQFGTSSPNYAGGGPSPFDQGPPVYVPLDIPVGGWGGGFNS